MHEGDSAPDISGRLLDELRTLRKRAGGATISGVATSPALCQLLGNGDPLVAWNRLQHLALEKEWSREIEAACYSLGFASTATTHLGRLEDFSAQFHMDQRQARRYSDRGLEELSRLISSNWVVHAVPTCDVVLNMASAVTCDVYARCEHPETLRMDELRVDVVREDTIDQLECQFVAEHRNGRCSIHFARPAVVPVIGETSVIVQWTGETWPKFQCTAHLSMDREHSHCGDSR
uniref:hypothetical protein n=1 Tax=Gordonia sp. B7-2 TaxID=3420932 RepID=UPI003D8A33A1